jgi:hypothetical protein
MNSHLSDAELKDQLLGIGSQTAETHLSACSTCRKQLQETEESIAFFRTAVITWSESEESVAGNAGRLPVLAKRTVNFQRVAWIACVALFCVSVAGLYWRHSMVQREVAATQNARSIETPDTQADNTLFLQVTNAVSAPVPAPMQALQIPIPQAKQFDNR